MRTSRRLIGLAICCLISAGCTSRIEQPAQNLVAAGTQQFSPPAGVTVSAGFGGPEGAAATPHYWMTSPDGTLTVTNYARNSGIVQVSVLLIAPPCRPEAARLTITVASELITEVVDPATGTRVLLEVPVQLGRSAVVVLAAHTPSCRVASDARDLYVGLAGLTAG